MKKLFAFVLITSFVLLSCKSYYTINKSDSQYYKITKKEDSIESKNIKAIISPYKNKLDAKMNEIIGYTDGLSKSMLESTLGNWVTDVIAKRSNVLTESEVDFAIQNYGGLRANEVAPGPITIGKIYEIMPFENLVIILKASGKVTKELFDRMAKYGGWPISNSVKYTIKDDKAANIFIKDKPFDINKSYIIALPDYIANGGNRCSFLKNQPTENTGVLIRDLLIEEVKEVNKKGEKVKSIIEGRVTRD